MSRKRKHEDPVDVLPIAESWSRTEQYTVKGRHQWTIDNFLHRAQFTEVGDSLCSPIFRIPVDEFRSNKPQELQFQLEVFPNGMLDLFDFNFNSFTGCIHLKKKLVYIRKFWLSPKRHWLFFKNW